jgi:hypothetical protein
MQVTDEMVTRFLNWPLPKSVCPDACVMNTEYPHRVGTNLLTAIEARQMLEYILTPEPKVTILINGTRKLQSPATVRGLELKVIAGMPCHHVVFRESPNGPGEDEYFNDFATIVLRDGDEIMIVPDRNPK